MSATGRSLAAETGHVRHPDDYYRTPAWCTRAILKHLKQPNRSLDPWVLDPCCGDGAILDIVKQEWRTSSTHGIEIDPGRAHRARQRHSVQTSDALGICWDPLGATIVTNPPYSLAMDFVSIAVKRTAETAFLLRLNWLASSDRAPFHRDHPADVYVLSRRPSFCASITCKKTPTRPGCGWHVTQEVDRPRPVTCPQCNLARLTITTSDASEYAWFVWGPGRGGRWSILDLDGSQ